MRFAKIVPRTL